MNAVLLLNSLLVAGATALAALLLGTLAALAMLGLGGVHRRWFRVGAVLAVAMPPFLLTNVWLKLAGLPAPEPGALVNERGLGATVLLLTLLFWPIPCLLVSAGWQRLGREHFDVEPRLRGWGLIRWWLIPAARGPGSVALALVFVLALNQFSVPALLQVKVVPAEVWVRYTTAFDTLGALLMSAPLVVAPLLLLLALRHREVPWPRRAAALDPALFRERFGAFFWRCCVAAAGVALLCSPVLPLWQLLASPRTWVELGPAIQAGSSALGTSLALASLTASCVLLVALCTARWRAAGVLWLLFLVPGVVTGVVLVTLLNRPLFAAFYQGIGVVLLAWGLRYFAPAWHATATALHSVDQNLLDAARVAGAGPWGRLRLAYLPQCAAPFAAAWYAVYLLCLWDTETLILLMPPGGETAALRVFGFLHYGHTGQVNGLCLALLALAVLPWAIVATGRALARRWAGGTFRTPAGAVLAGALGLLVAVPGLTSCTGNSSTHAALDSRFFSEARVIGSRGAGLGQFNKPRSVAVDAADNLYVADMTGRVQKFSPDGQYLAFWQMPQTDLGRPKGMSRDEQGRVVVLEPHYCRVNHFDPSGQLALQWGRRGTNVGELAFPRAVAVAPDGRVFVSEYMYTDRVQVFAPGGAKCERAFGSAGHGPGQFNRAEGLALDSAGRLHVADSCNHRIQVFEGDGRFVRAFGRAGQKPGDLSYPYDIAIDAAGRAFVCEFGNSRIQVFDAEGRSLEIIGGAGSGPGRFSNPWSVALDSRGNLYVADAMNHRVQKLIRRPAGSAAGRDRVPAVHVRDLIAFAGRRGRRPSHVSKAAACSRSAP